MRTDAVALQLINSKEPTATLQRLRHDLRPGVVDRLLHHAWEVSRAEGIAKGLTWAQLAQKASRISGRAADLAECLTFRGILLQDLYKESSGTADRGQYLDEALQCMLEALAIREGLDDPESLTLALGHVSSVYHCLGENLLAFIYRLHYLVAPAPSLLEGSKNLTRPLGNLAHLFWKLSTNESREASDLLLQHAVTLKQLASQSDPLARGDLFDILGVACRETGQYEQALQLWRQAGAEYSVSDAPARAFYVWGRAQDLAYHREEPEEMVELGLQCLRTAPEGVSAETLASRHHLLAFGYAITGRPAEAIAAYHAAARVVSDSEDRSHPGIYLLEAAHLETENGLPEKAREDFEKVLSAPAGAHTLWDAEYGLAEVSYRQGDLGTAIHWCDEAVALSIGNRMSFALRASALLLSGHLHLLAGNNGTAIQRIDDLLKIFDGTDKITPQSVTWYYTNLVFPHCVVAPQRSTVAFLGLMAAYRQGSKQAVEHYLDLYQHFYLQEQTETADLASATESIPYGAHQLARADSLLAIDPKQTIEILLASVPLLEDLDAPSLIKFHLTLGLAYFILGETVQAQAGFNRVLELAAQGPSIEEEIHARFYLGLIAMHSGALETAYDEISAVIRAKEIQRGSLADLELRQGFPQGAYWALIEVCKRLGRTRELIETAEKLKSRVLLDLLESSRRQPIDYQSLRDIKDLKQRKDSDRRQFLLETNEESMRRLDKLYEKDPENARTGWMESVDLGERITQAKEQLLQKGFLVELQSRAAALPFDKIRDLCASTSRPVVLVEYLVTSTEALVIIVRADLDRPQLVAVPLSGDRISKLANAGFGHRGVEVEEIWSQDMAQLLAPVLAWSDEDDLLWLVPHGPLHGLPLHAAQLDGRYVIERNPVFYSPSASAMKYFRRNRTERRETAIVLGDPTNNLPNARREAQLVAEMFGTTALVGGSATKSRLQESLEGSQTPHILHFAGHSLFQSIQPLESAMLLAPDRGTHVDKDGSWNLTAGEIFAWSLRTDLVTLSSCASGAQKVGPGDEPVGFARAFLYAGASSVLASLWPVNDLSTRILMEHFYRSLRQGVSKAEALQQAQLHLLHLTEREVEEFRHSRLGDPEDVANSRHRTLARDLSGVIAKVHQEPVPYPYRHPHFWAPFILMGDWS